jgi:hypothetical protein
MTIGEIIKKRVHELGGDGLVNLDSSCGCGDNDGWFPCDCPNTEECKPAKWIYCKSCENNGQCTLQEEYDLGKIDADGCYVQIEQQEKMPNEQKCSFCDDCFTVITNDDAHICGACADSLKLERDRLMAEIAKLEKALEKAIRKLGVTCPTSIKLADCKYQGVYPCRQCWREYLMKEEK